VNGRSNPHCGREPSFGCHLADSRFPPDLAKLANAPVVAGHGFTTIAYVHNDPNKIVLEGRLQYNQKTGMGVGPRSNFTQGYDLSMGWGLGPSRPNDLTSLIWCGY
jgi:hypothetical protein